MGSIGVLEELVTDILSRLPVKSLLRFKCVSKFWYSLIEHPYFIKKHYKSHKNNDGGRLFVHVHDYNDYKYAFAVYSDVTLSKPVYEYLEIRLNRPAGVYGPCNGIICLFNKVGVALWNPATRKFRILPQVPQLDLPSVPNKIFQVDHCNGFGIDPKTNDYKVVSIMTFYDNIEYDSPITPKTYPLRVAVYALGTNSWRLLDECVPANYVSTVDNFYTYSNGVYYWSAVDTNDQCMVLSFDMGDEIFRNIPLQGLSEGEQKYHKLGLYNDCVCCISFDHYCGNDVPFNVHVWVMNGEYHWTKQLTIGPLLGLGLGLNDVIGFWKNGELLVRGDGNRLVLCDPDTSETKYLSNWCTHAFVYHESLVSINQGYEYYDNCDNSSNDVPDFCDDEPLS